MLPFPLRRSGALIAALIALLAAAPATGAETDRDPIDPDQPGFADGSQVVGRDVFQSEIELHQEYNNHTRQLAVPLLLRYGLSDRWEARFESDTYTRQRVSTPPGVFRTSGSSPFSFGAKYHFSDEKEGDREFSAASILRITPPSGSGAFEQRHLTGDLRLAADWQPSGLWNVEPNVGIAVDEDDAGRGFVSALAALQVTYEPGKRLQPFVDVGLQAPAGKGRETAVLFDGGAVYLLNRNTALDFWIGTGVTGDTPELFWNVGLSHRF